MPDPTKLVTKEYDDKGGFTETAIEHLCSVEVGATAKGDAQIKSDKVYAADVSEAAEKAVETYAWLTENL